MIGVTSGSPGAVQVSVVVVYYLGERDMSTSHDVAAYILQKRGPMSAMKLQKLVYYSQAWSLVWEDRPLFGEEIQAWASGPVVPELYQVHKGKFLLKGWSRGRPNRLSEDDRDTIDAVLRTYARRHAQWLSELTHREAPWKDARQGIPPGEPSDNVITHEAMSEYYSSL
jgi:uncharacterized phage-associated protein